MCPEAPALTGLDRAGAADWHRRNRARTRQIFDVIDPSAYYSRPIALRNPIVFYEGHLPAFSLLAFIRRGLGRDGVDDRLETLFERGIDPDSVDAAVPRSGASTVWPSRDEVLAFGAASDARVLDALAEPGGLSRRAVEGLFTALEHEAMHQETLLYMWHRLPYGEKRKPAALRYELGLGVPAPATVTIPAGAATLGAGRAAVVFGWDNEFDAHAVQVPAFEVDVHNVTNAAFLEFVEAGGYGARELWSDAGWTWIQAEGVTHPAFWDPSTPMDGTSLGTGSSGSGYAWRGMFEALPLPMAWPVYVSHAEAEAFARWKGRRLMTEAEWHRAAEGARPGHSDCQTWEPVPTGARPGTESRWGVHDLMGNGWEWTSTIFEPFPGFTPMASYPEYSADFFDGEHYVMKGASPATAAELVRPSFRNWFRPNYPYVYAAFRTVSDA
jgi:gamma-glutamyl hercynylcysteine S-oxide synthase